MKNLTIPFTKEEILKLKSTHPTPFHVYDEKAIINNAKRFQKAFDGLEFRNYFAVKALPNPFILKILKNLGMGADCSSLPELELAKSVGMTDEDIMFTSNNTPDNEFKRAKDLGAIINLDDISHIKKLEKATGSLPELVCFRYNPGTLRAGNDIIGDPVQAKYGLTREQLFEGYKILKKKGVKRFGLHTMICSNELNQDYFIETAKMLFVLADEIKKKVGVKLEFVNLGGGIGIPYKPEQKEVDLEYVANGIKKEYDSMIAKKGLAPLKIYMECGRMITGPYGYVVTEAINFKETYKDYVGVDGCMANLMRPALYGAYHHITVMGKEDMPRDKKYDVVGSLCENNDKFAIDRMLPKVEEGDILVIHDAGAHGYAMGFNYNGKLRAAEFLMRTDDKDKKSFYMIRRAETKEDLFATLDFQKLVKFK